jgi:hypothetical protein
MKVVINASPFNYGAALVSYKPLPNFVAASVPAGTSRDATILMKSQRPYGFYIFPQNNQGGEVEYPFFYHRNWLDATTLADFTNMGQVHINSLTTLENANGAAGVNVDVSVYAWASDVALAGPTAGLALQSGKIEKDSSREFSSCLGHSIKALTKFKLILKRCTKAMKVDSYTSVDSQESILHSTDLEFQSSVLSGAAEVFNSSVNSVNNFVNESGKKTMNAIKDVSGTDDEYGRGVVSQPASAIAALTGKLKKVPVIGPFMRATSFVAEAGGRMASMFGWSNPPVIKDVLPFRNSPFHAIASPEICTPVDRLTLDPKNELTVDPRIAGLSGEDELMIVKRAQRENHLITCPWLQTDVTDTVLFSSIVSPNMANVNVNTYHPTLMAYDAHLFKFWRGDMIFRLRVIGTKFHRGRFRITWDPVSDISSATDTEMTTYTRVVDISQDDDLEFRIPYMQAQPWLSVGSTFKSAYASGPGTVPLPDEANGTLTIRVLNCLTAPDSTSSVNLAVSIMMGDNYQLCDPVASNEYYSVFEPQAGFLFQAGTSDKDADRSNDIDRDPEVVQMANAYDASQCLPLIYMGECIKSFRTLIRRAQFSRSELNGSDSTSAFIDNHYDQGIFPLSYGYDPNGIHSTGTANFNYTVTTPMGWLAPTFVGMRGSTNWYLNINSPEDPSNFEFLRFPNKLRSRAAYFGRKTQALTNSSKMNRENITNFLHSRASGGALTNTRTQNALTATAPFYSQFKFISTKPENYVLGSSEDGSDRLTFQTQFRLQPAASGYDAGYTDLQYYCSAGIDFTYLYLLNAPTVYYYEAPVTP